LNLLQHLQLHLAKVLIKIPNQLMIALGLLINIGLLWYWFAPPMAMALTVGIAVIYINILALYLQANYRRADAILLERKLWQQAEQTLKQTLALECEQAFKQALASEREQAEQRLKQTLVSEREQAEQRLKQVLASEREQAQQALKQALASEREQAEQRLKQALASEREQSQQRLKQTLASEREQAQQALKQALTLEREQAEQLLKQTLASEREQAEQRLKQALASERKQATLFCKKEKEQHQQALKLRDHKWFQPFARVFTGEDEQIFNQWNGKLGLAVKVNHLRYLQHRVNQIENLCLGRLAGTVQDMILRLLVASTINQKELRILEIGTLFGINSIVMYDILSSVFERVHVTMIDPLDGYYGGERIDLVTGLPITQSILERNLQHLQISPENYTLIQAYSTQKHTFEQAKQQTYHIMFIDGDHSYKGVKADFEQYHSLLEPAGYLLFDDYQQDSWPEVTQFVDEVIVPSLQYEQVGNAWHTAVFRKKYDDEG